MGGAVLGKIAIDGLTLDAAVDAIDALVASGAGGAVFTPNVDHVVLAERDAAFREAYRAASLRLADGMPLVWASRIFGQPLPERVAGSDLLGPLMRRAALRRWRVFLCGGAAGVAEAAARKLRDTLGVEICGVDAPRVEDPSSAAECVPIYRRIREARTDVALFAFGAPKQELLIHHGRAALGPTVSLGIGAGLDFVAGTARRAPSWMSRNGLEWLYRLVREPTRLWRRYLVRDPAFIRIAWRTYRARRALAEGAFSGQSIGPLPR